MLARASHPCVFSPFNWSRGVSDMAWTKRDGNIHIESAKITVNVKVAHWGNGTWCGFLCQFSLDAHVLWFVMVEWVCWSDLTIWPGHGTQATNGGATSERSEDIVFVPQALRKQSGTTIAGFCKPHWFPILRDVSLTLYSIIILSSCFLCFRFCPVCLLADSWNIFHASNSDHENSEQNSPGRGSQSGCGAGAQKGGCERGLFLGWRALWDWIAPMVNICGANAL